MCIRDSFSIFAGNHVITIGTHNEFFSFRNLFIRSFYGYYEFSNLTNLENNTPSYYERAYSRTSDYKPAAQFSVNQLGFYIQDEWTMFPTFKLTFGVRADIPFLPTEPGVNDSVSKYFPGYSTGDVPSGNVTVSYTHLRAHETVLDLVCRLLLEKKKKNIIKKKTRNVLTYS